jgi:2-(1,2-epoxy-1,2-dihydrophenyl)acetyl-CoA isomerase
METQTLVSHTFQSGVAEIVLNRPDKLNALTLEMVEALHASLQVAETEQVRALILRGEGRGFSAGRDISGVDPATDDAERVLAEVVNPLIRRVREFPSPTFAAIQGACLGVGLGLALACDVVIAAEDARLGSPFARIGAVLDSGGHAFFVERLGSHRALELIYTGRLLSGTEAAAWNLVNRCVANDRLLSEVRELATAVAQGPTVAFQTSKRLVHRLLDEKLSLEEVLGAEAAAQGAASRTADYTEGFGAFQAKRTPRFTGA